jgi:hypothetical protein
MKAGASHTPSLTSLPLTSPSPQRYGEEGLLQAAALAPVVETGESEDVWTRVRLHCDSTGLCRAQMWRSGTHRESSVKYGHNLGQTLFSHWFSRMCTTTPYLSSVKACTIAMGSGTSHHVLRFTGFDHRRSASAAAWSMPSSPLPHQRCGDGEVSGSGVSEGVSEARPAGRGARWWCRPTLKVAATPCRCASTTIWLCESTTYLCRVDGCQRLKEHVACDCSGRFG